MTVKKKRTTKKRGPKPTGKALPMRQLRMSKEQAGAVTAWAALQPDKPNWAEAVRRLVQTGLARADAASSARAQSSELAAQTIDHLTDPKSTPEDRAKRKGRLLKGPEEFRDMRADQPPARSRRK